MNKGVLSSEPWWAAARIRIVWAVLVVVAIVVALLPAVSATLPAAGAISNRCDGQSSNDQNSLRVSPSHGSVFYIDSGQNIDAAYLSYRIQNVSATQSRADLWMKVDTFTGGVVGLANPADATQPLGDLAASSTTTGFVLVKATSSTSKAQSHVVHVYSGKPGTTGARELYSCTYSFAKVAETIKAAANKVTSITSTAVSTVGSTMTITVLGATGTVGAGSAADGSMVWLSPVARSTWPTGALRLESTNFRVFTNQGRTQEYASSPYANQLRIPLPSGSKYYYTAVYTFRIIGTAAVTSADIIPIAQIASGTQIKHTDLGSISGALNPGASVVDLKVVKSVSTTSSVASDGTTTFQYSIALQNFGSAVQVDQVVDNPSSLLAFVPGSAQFNGAAIADGSRLSSDASQLIFAGPFAIPAGTSGTPTTRTLTYSMSAAPCEGAYSYVNRATATVGLVTIGSSNSTRSLTTASGTCGEPAVTVTTANESLPIDVTTAPATSITTSGATMNGRVDPNGTSGQDIVFEYGTSPTLEGASSVTVGQTSTSANAYTVSSALTGLPSGTVYYYRIRVGDAYGDIFSFKTLEPVGTPTATTTAATSVSSSSAVLNGSVDPNLVPNGAKVKFQWAPDSSTGACTSLGTVTTTGFVQSETDNSTEDALLLGAYPTDVSYLLSGLTANAYYCFTVVAYYNATTANWSTAAPASSWVSFRAVTRTAQTITFAPPASLEIGETAAAGATSTSGLTVTYTSDTPTVCTVAADGTITALTEGVCSITATQDGSLTVEAATPVTVTFVVTKLSQTITLSPVDDTIVGSPVVLTGSTTASGLTVTYTSTTPTVCSVGSDGTITPLAAGQCTIVASQAGDDTYLPADSKSVTLTVRLPQEITFPTPGSMPTAGTQSAGATTSASDLVVEYESLTPEICSVAADGTITGLNVGTCRIRATQPGSDLYAAATPVTVEFSITPGPPVVITTELPSGVYGTPYDVTLEAGGGDGEYSNWTFTGELPAGLTLDSDGHLSGTPLEAGEFVIEVTVDSAEFTSGSRQLTLRIDKKPHTISATDVDVVYGAAPQVSPAASSASLPLEYATSDSSVATVADGTITFGHSGVAVITVNASGNAEYVDAEEIAFRVTVRQATLTVTAPSPTVSYGDPIPSLDPAIDGFVGDDDAEVLLTAVSCSSSYDSSTPADQEPAVTCSGGSADDYLFDYVPGVISIDRIPQHITLSVDPLVDMRPSGVQSLTATSSSGLTVTMTTSGECTWADGVLTATSTEGECTVTASIGDSTNYLAAEDVVRTLNVVADAPVSRVLLAQLDVPGSSHRLDASLTVLWSLEPNVGDVVMSVPTTTAVCSVSPDGIVTLLAAGMCSIDVDVAADATYTAGHVTITFEVTKLPRTITLTPSAASMERPGVIHLTTSPSAGSGAQTISVTSGTDVCALSGNDVVGLKAGTCTVVVVIEEDDRYLGASSSAVTLEFTDPTPDPSPTPPSDDEGDGDSDGGSGLGPQGPGAPSPAPSSSPVPIALAGSASPSDSGRLVASAILPQPTSGARAFLLDGRDALRTTLGALSSEKLTGFAAGANLLTQVTGSRSVGQFVITPGGIADPVAIQLAIEESQKRLGTEFAHVVTATVIDRPYGDSVLGAAVTGDATDVFAASGLSSPVGLGALDVSSGSSWLEITAVAEGYVPGTVIYLAVTTQPVIVGASVANSQGEARITATVPVDLLGVGGHTVRLVGTRQLEGLTADASGSVVISSAAMSEIRRFDEGTVATVEIVGEGASGALHHVVREVPLDAETPWWSVWLLVLLTVALTLWQLFGRFWMRRSVVLPVTIVVVVAFVPLVAGWLSAHYEIMAWGAVVGVVGATAQWFVHRRMRRGAQGGGSVQTAY